MFEFFLYSPPLYRYIIWYLFYYTWKYKEGTYALIFCSQEFITREETAITYQFPPWSVYNTSSQQYKRRWLRLMVEHTLICLTNIATTLYLWILLPKLSWNNSNSDLLRVLYSAQRAHTQLRIARFRARDRNSSCIAGLVLCPDFAHFAEE